MYLCSSFYLVGHDWGSALAWRIAATVPTRIKRLVAISVGHPGVHPCTFPLHNAKQQHMPSFPLLTILGAPHSALAIFQRPAVNCCACTVLFSVPNAQRFIFPLLRYN